MARDVLSFLSKETNDRFREYPHTFIFNLFNLLNHIDKL